MNLIYHLPITLTRKAVNQIREKQQGALFKYYIVFQDTLTQRITGRACKENAACSGIRLIVYGILWS